MGAIDRLMKKLHRVSIGHDAFEKAQWITYDVPNGAVIVIDGPNVPWQSAQWMTTSSHLGYVTGYFN